MILEARQDCLPTCGSTHPRGGVEIGKKTDGWLSANFQSSSGGNLWRRGAVLEMDSSLCRVPSPEGSFRTYDDVRWDSPRVQREADSTSLLRDAHQTRSLPGRTLVGFRRVSKKLTLWGWATRTVRLGRPNGSAQRLPVHCGMMSGVLRCASESRMVESEKREGGGIVFCAQQPCPCLCQLPAIRCPVFSHWPLPNAHSAQRSVQLPAGRGRARRLTTTLVISVIVTPTLQLCVLAPDSCGS